MLTAALPPSPALSDTLDDFDLDALLAAQGPLSRFGTPPPAKRDDVVVDVAEVAAGDEAEERKPITFEDYGIASLHFSRLLTPDSGTALGRAFVIQHTLHRANLPMEVVAMSYNILRQLPKQRLQRPEFSLTAVASLALARSYAYDDWMQLSWWRAVAQHQWSTHEIDWTMLDIFQAIDWNLSAACAPEAVHQTMETLSKRPTMVSSEVYRIDAGEERTCWANGQLTPAASRPASTLVEAPRHKFLSLLE